MKRDGVSTRGSADSPVKFLTQLSELTTGKHISAKEAKDIGLIGHVVPDGQALAKAMEIAEMIANNGPLAVEAILKTLHETSGMTEKEALDYEYDYGWAVLASEDAKEGPKALQSVNRILNENSFRTPD